MSKLVVAIVVTALLVTGCSLLVSRGDDQETVPPVSVTSIVLPATSTPGSAPALPTATAPPTPVLPLSEPHTELSRSIPLAYFHISPENGVSTASLAERASFVTLTHGDEAFREHLRRRGYQGKVFQYLVASEVNGPGPYADLMAACDAEFRPLRNGIARDRGDFCLDIHPNEDWFLHNGAGVRLYDLVGDTGVWYHMNPAHPGWIDYAVSAIRADATGPLALGFDGIQLDNVELSMVKIAEQLANSDGTVREYQTDDQYREAWLTYLAAVSNAIRADVELWANMAADPNDGQNWEPYLRHLDGATFPAFATGYDGLSATRWENNLIQAEAAMRLGKSVVAVGLGEQEDAVLQQFAAASYLLVMDPELSFFRYVSSESRDALDSFWMYDNYSVTLGDPISSRYWTGSNWRRDFTCGYVQVDPSTSSAEIVQTECASE